MSSDANFSVEKQASDIEGLITRGAKALIITSGDAGAMKPIAEKALKAGIPVIAYDQLIDLPGVFYVSFDAKAVGRALAEGMLKVAPKGNYALIKGDDKDPNTLMMLEGFHETMKPFLDSGAIKIVGEQFIDGWKPEPAKAAMEQILTANQNKVDAVMVMNDGMASGVAEALAEQGLNIPISGQDGAGGALNRIARGQQTFTIWKNSLVEGEAAGRAAIALIDGKPVEGKKTFTTASGNKLDAILLPVELHRQKQFGQADQLRLDDQGYHMRGRDKRSSGAVQIGVGGDSRELARHSICPIGAGLFVAESSKGSGEDREMMPAGTGNIVADRLG